MTKFISRWSSDLEEEVLAPETMVVLETTDEYEETGLLDVRGHPIYRVRQPIGFRRAEDS